MHANVTQNNLKGSVNGDLQVNYNNIHKVYFDKHFHMHFNGNDILIASFFND